jgi:hypothetical protein
MANYAKEHAALAKLGELGWYRVPAEKGTSSSNNACSALQRRSDGAAPRVASGRTWSEVLAVVQRGMDDVRKD